MQLEELTVDAMFFSSSLIITMFNNNYYYITMLLLIIIIIILHYYYHYYRHRNHNHHLHHNHHYFKSPSNFCAWCTSVNQIFLFDVYNIELVLVCGCVFVHFSNIQKEHSSQQE